MVTVLYCTVLSIFSTFPWLTLAIARLRHVVEWVFVLLERKGKAVRGKLLFQHERPSCDKVSKLIR